MMKGVFSELMKGVFQYSAHHMPCNKLSCKISSTAISTIKVDQVLHMEGGQGQHSYANNSFVQKRIITKTRHILEESTKKMCDNDTTLPKTITIAELGCSSGPNAFEAILDIMSISSDIYEGRNLKAPEYKVFMNDLMGNDFNNLYRTVLPNFSEKLKATGYAKLGACFVSGTPGSFYGRLFPAYSLNLVHASSCVHFLSQIPKGLVSKDGQARNGGAICVTEKSPSKVYDAYNQQFAKDFTLFLSLRSQEIVRGGQMILILRGSTQSDQSNDMLDFEMLGMALHNMVLEGMMKEEKLEYFNLPFFTPSAEQVRKLVEAEGSFTINKLESFTVDWGLKDTDLALSTQMRAKHASNSFRAVLGPFLANQFGKSLIPEIFRHYEIMALERLHVGMLDFLNLGISMTRN